MSAESPTSHHWGTAGTAVVAAMQPDVAPGVSQSDVQQATTGNLVTSGLSIPVAPVGRDDETLPTSSTPQAACTTTTSNTDTSQPLAVSSAARDTLMHCIMHLEGLPAGAQATLLQLLGTMRTIEPRSKAARDRANLLHASPRSQQPLQAGVVAPSQAPCPDQGLEHSPFVAAVAAASNSGRPLSSPPCEAGAATSAGGSPAAVTCLRRRSTQTPPQLESVAPPDGPLPARVASTASVEVLRQQAAALPARHSGASAPPSPPAKTCSNGIVSNGSELTNKARPCGPAAGTLRSGLAATAAIVLAGSISHSSSGNLSEAARAEARAEAELVAVALQGSDSLPNMQLLQAAEVQYAVQQAAAAAAAADKGHSSMGAAKEQPRQRMPSKVQMPTPQQQQQMSQQLQEDEQQQRLQHHPQQPPQQPPQLRLNQQQQQKKNPSQGEPVELKSTGHGSINSWELPLPASLTALPSLSTVLEMPSCILPVAPCDMPSGPLLPIPPGSARAAVVATSSCEGAAAPRSIPSWATLPHDAAGRHGAAARQSLREAAAAAAIAAAVDHELAAATAAPAAAAGAAGAAAALTQALPQHRPTGHAAELFSDPELAKPPASLPGSLLAAHLALLGSPLPQHSAAPLPIHARPHADGGPGPVGIPDVYSQPSGGDSGSLRQIAPQHSNEVAAANGRTLAAFRIMAELGRQSNQSDLQHSSAAAAAVQWQQEQQLQMQQDVHQQQRRQLQRHEQLLELGAFGMQLQNSLPLAAQLALGGHHSLEGRLDQLKDELSAGAEARQYAAQHLSTLDALNALTNHTTSWKPADAQTLPLQHQRSQQQQPAAAAVLPQVMPTSCYNNDGATANPMRYTRVITCKTYLKRLNITQPMAQHLMPLHDLNVLPGAAAAGDSSNSYELLFKDEITIINAAMGQPFRVTYEGVACNGQKHLRLTAGWRDFVRANSVAVGAGSALCSVRLQHCMQECASSQRTPQ